MVLTRIDPYPLKCSQREDKTFLIYLKKPDGSIYNLAGCSIAAQVRDGISTIVCTLTCQIVDAAQGLARVQISSAGSSKAGLFYWDIRVTRPDNSIDFLPVSSFTIARSVTA